MTDLRDMRQAQAFAAAGLKILPGLRPEQQQPVKPNGHVQAVPEISPINFGTLPDAEPSPRRFIIAEWLPHGCMSSLYGPGGVGKSLLAQQAATCIATGRDFIGSKTERVPVLGLFAEDDDEELVRRQWRINQALGLTNDELSDLHIQGRAGLDNSLLTFPAGAPQVEALYEATIKTAKNRGCGLVILDNRAQMLLGNENDRAQATYAANLCAGIAREIKGAVLLLGHVAKAEGSEYSGSTAWDAVTRSRWWLRRAEAKEEDGPPELILDRVKSNYAGQDTIRLVWSGGILRAVDEGPTTYADRLAAEQRRGEVRQVFLDTLAQLTAQGRTVSHSPRASNYAPKVMRKRAMVEFGG